ncbi:MULTISPECIES: hypothetical protein [unclassified Haloferax]|jgi:hypothetical protein|uniref:hypothetical protein n=1 Tax=unclassified Haloferax TaxID=2625095 RepID=UPI002875D015|nr:MULTISPECIES: hypothetical protein [unclassified Haloferax]MDS0243123.1 hypothetical protein [Haloferax sp. S2CR25]MDS0446244.1 hypothetical protein [Haloferax sp. S2CR25-2]
MSDPDLPTSIIRQAPSGEYPITIPRKRVEDLGITDKQKLGLRPDCDETGMALDFILEPDDGANVVTVKMQGPRGRQAIIRPPRKLCAILALNGATAAWAIDGDRLRAKLNIEPTLNVGYLGAFVEAIETSIFQRTAGNYTANLPAEKVRPLRLSKGDLLRVKFECLRSNDIFILETKDVDPDAPNTYTLQMSGPQNNQPRFTVTRSLGDGLQLAQKRVGWVVNRENARLVGRVTQ